MIILFILHFTRGLTGKAAYLNNKMFSLVFYRVIKAASIAEKKFITRVKFFLQ
jgi:hypothetical protein